MHNHQPETYDCPCCHLVAGLDMDRSSQGDVNYRAGDVTAIVSLHWRPNNPGHGLVVPNAHFENACDLSTEHGNPIQCVARSVAWAMKAASACDGDLTVQHYEPHGNQDVWHYHVHVFPRYEGDDLHESLRRMSTAKERRPYAEKLRSALSGTS